MGSSPRWTRPLVTTAVVLATAAAVPAPASAQASPDAHFCLLSADTPPRNEPGDAVYYGAGVTCFTDTTMASRGIVASVDISVEILTEIVGVTTVLTGNSLRTGVTSDTLIGVRFPDAINPQGYCQAGMFWGRTRATAQFRSGSPEYASTTVTTARVPLQCRGGNTGPPDTNPPDISIPPLTTTPRRTIPVDPCPPPSQSCL